MKTLVCRGTRSRASLRGRLAHEGGALAVSARSVLLVLILILVLLIPMWLMCAYSSSFFRAVLLTAFGPPLGVSTGTVDNLRNAKE